MLHLQKFSFLEKSNLKKCWIPGMWISYVAKPLKTSNDSLFNIGTHQIKVKIFIRDFLKKFSLDWDLFSWNGYMQKANSNL